MAPDGVVASDPALAAAVPETQAVDLQGHLVRDARSALLRFGDGAFPHITDMVKRPERDLSGLGNGPQGPNVTIVWKVGNDLPLALDAGEWRLANSMNQPGKDFAQRTALKGIVATQRFRLNGARSCRTRCSRSRSGASPCCAGRRGTVAGRH